MRYAIVKRIMCQGDEHLFLEWTSMVFLYTSSCNAMQCNAMCSNPYGGNAQQQRQRQWKKDIFLKKKKKTKRKTKSLYSKLMAYITQFRLKWRKLAKANTMKSIDFVKQFIAPFADLKWFIKAKLALLFVSLTGFVPELPFHFITFFCCYERFIHVHAVALIFRIWCGREEVM